MNAQRRGHLLRLLPFGTLALALALASGYASADLRVRGALLPEGTPQGATAPPSFVNWETPHVHPLDVTPDGTRLLAVNTPDNRLEVFDLTSGTPVHAYSVPVGLDPVTVRARTNDEAWVVNQISDSVSIVDLTTSNVVETFPTDDEPADVVFAGNPVRAFVSCSQVNAVLVYDLADTSEPIQRVPIRGEDPRAMAVSPDGDRVYVAIFESGNATTLLGGGFKAGAGRFPPNVTNDPAGPYSGQNPPPNSGAGFDPPIDAGLPAPPPVSLIVRFDDQGRWMDDNNGDWTDLVTGPMASHSGRPTGWRMLDHDVAVIDANKTATQVNPTQVPRINPATYVDRLMNICMAIGVNPVSGAFLLVGTEATNEIRFEPKVNGTFVRVHGAMVDVSSPPSKTVLDLNDHLTYASHSVVQTERDKSIGDPRGVAWNALGTRAYITGMGSNNLIVLDSLGNRAGIAPAIEVGEGPTGVKVDDARLQLYVLNKFDSSISVVNTVLEIETARIPFYDPSPAAIRIGRKHLYDTHKTSGMGQVACASCHVDARMDRLAWDLGNPEGAMAPVAHQNLGMNIPGRNSGFEDFHPMKGPMTTQTLQDIIGKEPLHWRGDKDGLEDFNGAFTGLQGDDTGLTPDEMQEYEDFLATVCFPPNPFRNLDNSLPTDLPLPNHATMGRYGPVGQPLPNGNAVRGLELYRPPNLLDAGATACVTCHTLPTGMGSNFELVQAGQPFEPMPEGPNGNLHHALSSNDATTNVSMKIPHLRNLYDKVGYDLSQTTSTAGFGFVNDGALDRLERFLEFSIFRLEDAQEMADMVAFLLAFSGSDLPEGSDTDSLEPPGTPSLDTHAAVGAMTTLVDGSNPKPGQLTFLTSLFGMSTQGEIGVVAKGVFGGEQRGFVHVGGNFFQSDRATETVTQQQLRNAAMPGSELTVIAVPRGSEFRIGIDRDEDGYYDRDELDRGSDPADPESTPVSIQQKTAPQELP